MSLSAILKNVTVVRREYIPYETVDEDGTHIYSKPYITYAVPNERERTVELCAWYWEGCACIDISAPLCEYESAEAFEENLRRGGFPVSKGNRIIPTEDEDEWLVYCNTNQMGDVWRAGYGSMTKNEVAREIKDSGERLTIGKLPHYSPEELRYASEEYKAWYLKNYYKAEEDSDGRVYGWLTGEKTD